MIVEIAIVGAGRLGTVLAVAFQRAGHRIVSASTRTKESADGLAALLPECVFSTSAAAAAALGEIVFLTVPDDTLKTVDALIDWRPGQMAVHCAGARPAGILIHAMESGSRTAGFHPLQSFADLDAGLLNLPGSSIGIEADDDSWSLLSGLAQDIGATPLRIGPDDRALYHAASALISNGTVGLMAVAAELWSKIGIPRDQAVAALLPLLQGTVRNLDTVGLPDALTGPIVRGDIGTVAGHLAALAALAREQAVYRSISTWLIDLAIERGTITTIQAEALRSILEQPKPGGDPGNL